MIHNDIVLLKHINDVATIHGDLDTLIIKKSLIIPVNKHHQHFGGVDADLLKELGNLHSPEYVLDSVMCYAELKVIVVKTIPETCINEFCKTHNVWTAFKKFQLIFLGPSYTKGCTRQLEDEPYSLKYMGEFKSKNFQICVAHHKKIFEEIENVKADGSAGIEFGMCV